MMPNMTTTTLADTSGRSSTTNSNKKRCRSDDEGDVHLTPEALAQMSRSERKKFREKKRRSDVNKGFDDLIDLLVEIDPVVKAEHEDRVRRGATEEHLLSRVELIGRTVDVLRRVHKENEERKMIIQQLLQNKPPTHLAGSAPLAGSNPSNDKQAPVPIRPQDSVLGARQAFAGLTGVGQNPLLSSVTPWQQQRIGGTTITTFLPGTMDLSLLAASAAQQAKQQPIALPSANLPGASHLRSVVHEALSRYTEQTAQRSPPQQR